MLQLRAFLRDSGSMSMFGEGGAEAVMKIFDTDGLVAAQMWMLFNASLIAHSFCSNGKLDAEELRILQEFIENEKKDWQMKR